MTWLVCTRRIVVGCVVSAGLLASGAGQSLAAEPFERFLEALRRREYYDTAIDYLDQMRNSPLITPEQRNVLTFEEGRTYLEQGQKERDLLQKAKQLEQAKAKFEEFVAGYATHPLVGSAQMQLGNVVVERAHLLMIQSALPAQAANKDKLVADARQLFDEAKKVFDLAGQKFDEQLKEFGPYVPETDVERTKARDRVRQDFVQSQMFLALATSQEAKTYPEGSADFKRLYQEAADKYERIYVAYRRSLAGMQARIMQGQCFQQMGDPRRALGIYADVLTEVGASEDARARQAMALYLSMQCWMAEPDQLEQAVNKGEDALKIIKGDEGLHPNWLAVRYHTAKAHKLSGDGPLQGNPARRTQAMNQARAHAEMVARYPGPFMEPAKELVREITGESADPSAEPTNFAEAFTAARKTYEAYRERQQQLNSADPAQSETVEQLRAETKEALDKAIEGFNNALALRTDETNMVDVNAARFYLCVLYMQYHLYNPQEDRFYDSAVLGEFLVTNYPSAANVREASKIVAFCYTQTFNDKTMPLEMRQFERDKLLGLVPLVERQWPDSPEVQTIAATALQVLLQEKDVEKAAEFLAKIGEDSPERTNNELRMGQAYWDRFLSEQRKTGELRPPQEKLDEWIANAKQLLSKSVTATKGKIDEEGAQVSIAPVVGALSLATIHVNAGETEQAIQLLEDPTIGPLTLVDAKNPMVTAIAAIPSETYRIALQAYVGAQNIEKAAEVMDKLERLTEESGRGKSDLTRIYISVARDLEEQIIALRKENNLDAVKRVAKGFEMFLERIAKSDEGNTYSSLNWVADTFYSLGAGYDTGSQKLSPEAKSYYEKSLAASERLLERSLKEPGFAPSPDAILLAELRQARTMRRIGKFKESVDLLQKILAARPFLLEAQKEGAQAFMDWGATEDPAYYNLALRGARKNEKGENIIWGWAQLSANVQGEERFADDFIEARFQVSNCLTQQAEHSGTSAEDKKRLLAEAERNIFITSRLQPTMGGPEWQTRFDTLLRTIQKLAGKPPEGLKAFGGGAAG